MSPPKSHIQKLLKKIEYINYALTHNKSDLSVHEFHMIYNEIIEEIVAISKEMDSNYLAKKVSLFPSITVEELNIIKSHNNREDNAHLINLVVGPTLALFRTIIPTKRKRMTSVFLEKESNILSLYKSISYVLKNPGFDKLLK